MSEQKTRVRIIAKFMRDGQETQARYWIDVPVYYLGDDSDAHIIETALEICNPADEWNKTE